MFRSDIDIKWVFLCVRISRNSAIIIDMVVNLIFHKFYKFVFMYVLNCD